MLLKNIIQLKKTIDEMDRKHKYRPNNLFRLDTKSFEEYSSIVEQIKNEIKKIEDNEGIQLYKDYNRRIWLQLSMLSLTNSDNKFYLTKDISECDKKSLENILSDDVSSDNYYDKRKLLMMYWVDGIACLNGIERYLQYIQKRQIRFDKIHSKLSKASGLKGIFDDIKSNIE